MKKTFQTGVLLAALLFAMASSGFAAPMEVYVSIPPQKWLTDQLGGEKVVTHVLVDKGQDPHTFEPTPRQISALSRSRLYFTIGLEFEKQITGKLGGAVAGLTMVDTTGSLEKIAMTGGHDPHGEHGDHHQEATDPHVWLSPPNLIRMADDMAAAMISADPGNAEYYRQNLQRTSAALGELHKELAADLASFKGAAFYVFHPSFGYFAREYQLEQEAVEIAGKSPSPRQLSALITRARAEGVRIIFVQPQFDVKSAATVAQAIDGVVEPLDPLAEDVAGNLRTISAKIKTALDQAAER
jgi:zinc transport system substrate-binding protein